MGNSKDSLSKISHGNRERVTLDQLEAGFEFHLPFQYGRGTFGLIRVLRSISSNSLQRTPPGNMKYPLGAILLKTLLPKVFLRKAKNNVKRIEFSLRRKTGKVMYSGIEKWSNKF